MTGSTGEWRRVTRVVPLAADLVLRDRARRAVERVAEVRGATLARCSQVQVVPEGVAVVHDEPVGSRPLVECAGQGPALVLRVLADGAAGIAALHDAGTSHGGVAAPLLLVTADGRGVLSGAGLAVAAGRGEPSPADDVRALADLALELLPARGVPAAAVHTLVRATDPDADLRPAAADLAQTLGTAARRAASDPPTGPIPVVALAGTGAAPTESVATEAATEAVAGRTSPPDSAAAAAATPRGTAASPPARRRGVVGPDPVPWPVTLPAPQRDGALAAAAAPRRARGAAPARVARPVRPAAPEPGEPRRRERGRRGVFRVVAPLAVAAALVLGAGALRAVGGTLEPDPTTTLDAAVGATAAPAAPPGGAVPPVDGTPPGSSGTGGQPAGAPTPVTSAATGGGGGPAGASTGAAAVAPSGGPAPQQAAGARLLDRGAGGGSGRAPDWRAVVTGLDAARAAAYADPEGAALDQFDLPGSPAWERDEAALRDLRARGEAVVGLVTELVDVRLVARQGDRATVRVTDRRSAYTLVGATTRAEPAAPERRWTVVLQRTADGWRYRSAELR